MTAPRAAAEGPLLRSMLFVPGDQPRMMEKARALPADALILDLEDGVAAKDKPQARTLIREALVSGFPPDRAVWLRPNALATGLFEDDLLACLLPGVSGIVLPKSRSARDVAVADSVIGSLARARGVEDGAVRLALLVETPQAVLRAADLAEASARTAALIFGADDLAGEMGLQRTPGNDEVRHARAHVALAAHAAGLEAIDIVHTAVRDLEGLARECREGKGMGYTGKQVIHPGQLEPVHAVFSPSADETAWARRIVDAYQAAPRGALVVDGRMVDAPIVRQAERILARAGRVERRSRR
ncbi:MAG TPA: CoA ester lyase [bacterium]|nr:CoA ester lyase [bacterium]